MVPESSDPLRRVTLLMLVTSDVFPRARTTDIKSSRRQGSPHAPKQFLVRMGTVKDVETARALITYTAPNEPLSIYSRWDLGFGTTPRPKTIPDGAIDAKAMTASMTRHVRNLRGRLDMNRPRQIFSSLSSGASRSGRTRSSATSRTSSQGRGSSCAPISAKFPLPPGRGRG